MYGTCSAEGKRERRLIELLRELAGGRALDLMTAAVAHPPLLTWKICSSSCRRLCVDLEGDNSPFNELEFGSDKKTLFKS